jgi:glycosyltransferase involved in cell wall biosynthesis
VRRHFPEAEIRVLVVTHYFPEHGGGIEQVAGQIASRLASRGIRIEWIASRENNARDALPPGGHAVPNWNVFERLLGVPYPLWGWSAIAEIQRAIGRCDIVHVHDSLYMGNALACELAGWRGQPTLVTQHVGFVPYRSPILRGAMEVGNRLIAARVLRKATATVFCSKTTQEYFVERAGSAMRHEFIPNGVELGRFKPVAEGERAQLKRELGWPLDRTIFLFVGRFVEKKGLAICRELARELPETLWAFVGWGPDDPACWSLNNVLAVGKRSQSDIARFYQAADLLILPSVGEGFPLVVQEAMACGTPIAISRETVRAYPGLESVAWSTDPTTPSFAALLRNVLTTPQALISKRTDVADFARREWDWDRSVQRYESLIRGLVQPVI